jgi:peptidoglycan/xylan/chitin deacetylase (PgdA/CDA1 family)
MRQVSVHTLALAALVVLATIRPLTAGIEDASGVNVEACASDPKRLGLSRIVEIDTSGGVNIGGEQPGHTQFLKDGEVVLTFDDGPIKAYTRAVLKALADHCTKATFFMVGRMAVSDPEMVREVAAGGHTIGSHTWSHRNLRPTVLLRARQEIESAISAISKINGAPIAPLFRFPYLNANQQVEDYLKTRNIGTVWIDLDSKDYRTRDPRVVEQRIISQLVTLKKGIILMHDIQPSTAKMLPSLLNELRDRGFKVVHMVPKTRVKTIASFDAAAEQAIAAKTAARIANPMATHSMVWTMAPTPVPAAGTDAASTTAGPPAKQEGSTGAKKISTKPSIDEGMPGSDSQPPKTAAPTSSRAKKAAKPKDEDVPFQLNVFSD